MLVERPVKSKERKTLKMFRMLCVCVRCHRDAHDYFSRTRAQTASERCQRQRGGYHRPHSRQMSGPKAGGAKAVRGVAGRRVARGGQSSPVQDACGRRMRQCMWPWPSTNQSEMPCYLSRWPAKPWPKAAHTAVSRMAGRREAMACWQHKGWAKAAVCHSRVPAGRPGRGQATCLCWPRTASAKAAVCQRRVPAGLLARIHVTCLCWHCCRKQCGVAQVSAMHSALWATFPGALDPAINAAGGHEVSVCQCGCPRTAAATSHPHVQASRGP